MKPIMIDLCPDRREDKSQLMSPAPITRQGNQQRAEQLRVASVEPVLFQPWETLSLTAISSGAATPRSVYQEKFMDGPESEGENAVG